MAEFFDKLKQSIDKGITTVSVKSKEMMETQRVKGEIESIRRDKRGILQDLGNIVYAMFQQGCVFDQEAITAKCRDISDVDARLAEKEKELEQIHARAEDSLTRPPGSGVFCECGEEITPETKFCGKCGKRVGHRNTCPNCGAELPAEAKFCGKCGMKI